MRKRQVVKRVSVTDATVKKTVPQGELKTVMQLPELLRGNDAIAELEI